MTAIFQRKIGSRVKYDGEELDLVANIDFETVRLRSKKGEFFTVKIAEIGKASPDVRARSLPVDPHREAKHERYLLILGPLLDKPDRTRGEVEAAAKLLGISTSRAYAALARFEVSGNTKDLPPPTRPGGRGKTRLKNAEAAKIIEDELAKVVQGQTKTMKAFLKATKAELKKKNLTVSDSTLRSRFNSLGSYVHVRARKGHVEADRTVNPKPGRHPDVPFPFFMVQIDHWKIDVEILDDERLNVIGRAWLTVGIDVYSRMICGWHVGVSYFQ